MAKNIADILSGATIKQKSCEGPVKIEWKKGSFLGIGGTFLMLEVRTSVFIFVSKFEAK